MKRPDEIKKGLECCAEDGCKECPYEDDCYMVDGFSALAADALALIQQLTEEAGAAIRRANTLMERVHLLEAERDAAIRDMTEIVQDCGEPYCDYCGADFKPECSGKCWTHNEGFKWRGVQKEETP